jgi:alkylhydroperoxidase/carboxymuconolactone decarboxylase family protein YurZ
MEEEKHIIETLANIGVEKETILEIMHELLFASSKYADNQEAIDTMLQEKLGIDLYITLTQYKNLNK